MLQDEDHGGEEEVFNPNDENDGDGGVVLSSNFTTSNHNNNNNTTRSWKRSSMVWYYLKEHWMIIILGQVLSFTLAGGGAAQATLHVNCNLSSPTFTMAMCYFLLSWHLVWMKYQQNHQILFTRTSTIEHHEQGDQPQEDDKDGVMIDRNPQGQQHQQQQQQNQQNRQDERNGWDPYAPSQNYTFLSIKLQRPVWNYVVLALIDVEANAITMLAFKYTTLTSVSLFDALAIPSAMILSRSFLGRKYTTIHLLGVTASMVGVILNVFQDYESSDGTTNNDSDNNNNTATAATDTDDELYPHKLRGDLFAILGGIMYGISNVLVEMTVRTNGRNTTEYLGMLGACGFIIAFIQSMIFERDSIREFFGRDPDESSSSSSNCTQAMGWWLYSVFVGVTVLSYVGASYFLTISEAAYFSLSLLTGDLWAVLFSIFAEQIIPGPIFFGALVLVLSGIIIYEMAPSPVLSDNNSSDQEQRHQQVSRQLEELSMVYNSADDDDDDDDKTNHGVLS